MNNIDTAKDILIDNGYSLDKDIIQDGNVYRFGKKNNQWYVCYDNYIVAGDWQGQLPEIKQFIDSSKSNQQLTLQQRQNLENKIESEKKAREAELLKQYSQASIKAKGIWQSLSNGGNSSYLKDKGLTAIKNVKFGKDNKGGFIATALIDNQNNINSLQYIYDDGFKKFLSGGKIKGCYSEFGNKKSNIIFICEGLATALSILLAKPDSLIIVAYNCNNLKEATKNIKIKYPNHKIIIAGDNDIAKEKNIGKEKAEKTAKEFNLSLALPSFKDISSNPSDFDDLRQLEGIEEVKKQLETVTVDNNKIIPIKNDNLKPVKEFDIDNFLPDELKEFVKDVSYRLCVPADFIAIPLIIGFSSLIAGKAAIKPKQNDDFCIFANLWGGLIGNPSTRKTPSLKEALFFFSLLESNAKDDYDSKKDNYQKELNKYKLAKKALEDEYIKLIKGSKNTTEIEYKLDSLQEPEKVILQRYRINEATSQKITEILRDNQHSSLLLERDELAGFLSNLDKKENEADRSYFLEMWNGNASIRNDTIGRGSIIANNAAISIIGTTQPDLIKRYLDKTIKNLNDGLLQRFQLLVYPDIKENKYIDDEPNKQAKNNIIKIANFLNDDDFFNYASGSVEKEGKNYPCFNFNKEAQAIYQSWYIENDKKLNLLCKQGKTLISQHLSKYHKLLPALCLIFHLVKADKKERQINANTLSKAILFCNYLESHAKRIYNILSTEDNYNNPALELIEKIKDKIINDGQKSIFLKEFTKRELKRKFNSYKDEDLNKILNTLIEHNYLTEKHTEAGYQQREKYSYLLNQQLIRGWQNGQ